MPRQRRVGECMRCRRVKQLPAHGICSACYMREYRLQQPQKPKPQTQPAAAAIVRVSNTYYELRVDGRPVGAGNTLQAAQTNARRYLPYPVRWARSRHRQDTWTATPLPASPGRPLPAVDGRRGAPVGAAASRR